MLIFSVPKSQCQGNKWSRDCIRGAVVVCGLAGRTNDSLTTYISMYAAHEAHIPAHRKHWPVSIFEWNEQINIWYCSHQVNPFHGSMRLGRCNWGGKLDYSYPLGHFVLDVFCNQASRCTQTPLTLHTVTYAYTWFLKEWCSLCNFVFLNKQQCLTGSMVLFRSCVKSYLVTLGVKV